MASYTEPPEDGRRRRDITVAFAFLFLAAVALYAASTPKVADHLAQKLGGSRALELNPHAEREAARILPS